MGALIILSIPAQLAQPVVFDLFVVHWMHIAETIYRSEPGATDHETFPV